MSSESRYATVILDVDSTVAGIEGIDWLAALRTPDIAAKIAELTRQVMAGALSLESVYAERLRLVAPRAGDMAALGRAYVDALAPGCRDAVAALRAAGVRVVLLSGGLREALLPIARALGVPHDDVHAVGVRFNADGSYADFDRASPLAASGGKRIVIERLALPRPILAVGDGATDVDMKPVVDTFAAFTGFARRDAVVNAATVELRSFAELARHVMTSDPE
jgi:phosphoserine phosphatase